MTCLACVVVFCTVYALILPAVTIENNVSTSNTAVNENTFVPPEKNIYPIDAYNTYEGNPNVILLSPKLDTLNEAYKGNRAISIENFFTVDEVDNFDYSNWIAYFIQVRGGRFQVIRRQDPSNNIFYVYNDNQEAYIILVRKSYEDEHELYIPTAGPDATAWENEAVDGVGDTVKNIWLPGGNPHSVQNSSGTPLAYFTFSPKENTATADVRGDDLPAIADSAIKFQLFDYNEKINRPAADSTDWRKITPYFQFRGQNDFNGAFDTGQAISTYDADGFTVNHATVERKLTDNYPVLDPNRNASGDPKKTQVTEDQLPMEERSLKYLFSEGDHAVTAYSPTNTILQKDGTHYFYNSAKNAVDYDTTDNVFRIRNYVERNGPASKFGTTNQYYDFLPFNYTGGQVIGTYRDDGGAYNLESKDVDYWFGMRMDVDFYQSKDGMLNGEPMIFKFNGDDDIWVFIDDVLVLDLGGTHGAVTGTINFATGRIEQHLDWIGHTEPSYPTTIKKCYEAAEGASPNGGWNGDIFTDYTKHKLSFFYLERACGAATCSIDFNLPTLPDKSLKVSKTLQADNDAYNDTVRNLENTMEYKFRVVKADASGNPTDELLIKAGDSYIVSGGGVNNETRRVGENGYFTLKAEQTAEFTDMLKRFDIDDSVKNYVVQEVLPTDQTGQYSEVYYNIIGSGTITDTCITDTTTVAGSTVFNSPTLGVDVANLVNYVNKVDTAKLSSLAINKINVGTPLYDWEYYMKVQLGPNADSLMPIPVGTIYYVNNEPKKVTTAGIIKLKASESINVWDGTSSTAPTKGSGSESDPYIIKTPAELYYVVFEAGDSTKDKYYKLANNIYLNDTSKADWETVTPKAWESKTLVNNDTDFRGHFDGNGYVVHGIYTDNKDKNSTWYKAALFPRVEAGESDISIKNVGVEDSAISGNQATAAIVGQIAGSDSATITVSGCYADESVKVNGTGNVGGLVGLVEFIGTFKLENCFSRVHLNYSGTKQKADDIGLGYGSLVGWFVNDVDSSKRQLTNCYAVVFNEDFTEGFNTVPVGSWGDEPIMEHVTYSGTSGSNEDNTGKVQRGEHQQYWVPQRWVSDFKGTLAKEKLPEFDWEKTWYADPKGGFLSLKIFNKPTETAEIKLLSGTCYSVVEVADENGTTLTSSEVYTPAYLPDSNGTATGVGDTVKITVTNTFQTGNLELTKKVDHTSGGSTNGEFDFELKFKVGESWTDTY